MLNRTPLASLSSPFARIVVRGTVALAMTWAMLSSSPAQAAAGTRTLRFAIERNGLHFTGPCGAVIFQAAAKKSTFDDAVENISDISDAEVEVAPGKYHVVVTCPSTEGALAKTFPVDLRSRAVDLVARLEPGFVLTEVRRNEEEINATMRVFDVFSRLVAEGGTKSPLPVPPGRYRVEAHFVEKIGRKKIALQASTTTKVLLGKKSKVALDLSDGVVTVDIRDNGKPVEGLASLMMPNSDDRVVELRVREAIAVPPGTYDLVTQLDNSHDFYVERVKGVVVKSNAKKNLRANHRTGGVLPKVILDGKTLAIGEGGEKVDVMLFLGAAPKEFNILDGGEAARLHPNKYRVRVRRATKLDDNSEWTGEVALRVSAGGTRALTVDVTPARWKLQTSVGGKPRAVSVEIFTEKGSARLLKRMTAADDESSPGTLSLNLPEGIYRAVATLDLPQGPVVKETRVALKRRRTKVSKFAFNLGVVVIQVMDKGVAVPAKVSFIGRDASAPMLTLKAGHEALLPPGRYTLSVTRRKITKIFSEIVVNTRRPLERTLDFSAGEVPKGAKDDDSKTKGKSKSK